MAANLEQIAAEVRPSVSQKTKSKTNLKYFFGQTVIVFLFDCGLVSAIVEFGRQIVDIFHFDSYDCGVFVQSVGRYQSQIVLLNVSDRIRWSKAAFKCSQSNVIKRIMRTNTSKLKQKNKQTKISRL
jgi:hypothetical protein